MENITFFNKQKSIFENKKTKVAIGPRTCAAACVCGPKLAYIGTLLRMQLGFKKYEKGKFSAIMAKILNASHLIWEPFQTPFFPLYKALHSTFLKTHRNPTKKIQDSLENSESKWSFFIKHP